MRSRFIVVALLGLVGAFLLIDGINALVTGSYFEADGEVDRWLEIFADAPLAPDGITLKILHIVAGLLAMLAAFTIAAGWGAVAWWLGVTASLLVLWFMPWGTLAGAVSILVLSLPGPRLAILGR